MTRKKKLLINTVTALVYQLVTTICGFVLPKFIVPHFGSAANGLISSITQFLAIITLCECGIGAVVQSALYKPLADRDDKEISRIVISSNAFFHKVMCMLVGYVAVLMLIYPIIVRTEFPRIYTMSMILILAISYIVQYYLFLTYRLLLNADQASYVQLSAHTISLIINALLTVILIKLGASVHSVKLGSVVAFLLQPLYIKYYVNKNYNLNLKIKLTQEPITQKWNGLAQHVASVIHNNTATMLLTLFSTLENISIYSVYYLVAHGIRQVVASFSNSIKSMLGNMYAKGEKETLDRTFTMVEFMYHTLVTLLFGVTGVLIIPFVKIYTVNFSDVEYVRPVFSGLMVLGQAIYCLRIPYEMMIQVAGHYKETQKSSWIEAILTIIFSVGMITIFALEGVAIGYILGMIYRILFIVWYMQHNILNRSAKYFLKHVIVDVICVVLIIAGSKWLNLECVNYIQWIGCAFKVMGISLAVIVSVNWIMYYKEIRSVMKTNIQ